MANDVERCIKKKYVFHEMASVTYQLIEEITAHAQGDSLEDAREICADGTYFPNNLRITMRLFSFFSIELS